MAIQVRRGTNAEWENTNQNIVAGEPAVALDSERFFVGTGAGTFAEYANVKSIASAYSTTRAYREGDYVMYNGKLYVCTTATTGGAWNAANWEETSLLDAMTGDIPYRNYETTSVSGDIVSFDNGAGGIPVEDLEIEVSATQDLNGYDHPWSGGAGKNLLACTATTSTISGVTFTVNADGTVIANGTATADVTFNTSSTAGVKENLLPYLGKSVICNGCPSGGSTDTYFMRFARVDGSTPQIFDTGTGVTTTVGDLTDVNCYVRIDINSGVTVSNLTFKPMIRLATETDDTFVPYENICPISGFSEVGVKLTGKNMIDPDFLLQASGWTKDDNGVYSGQARAIYNAFRQGVSAFTIRGKQSITISFYAWSETSARSIYVNLHYKDDTYESLSVQTATRTLFQIHSDPTKEIRLLSLSYSNNIRTYIDSFQIEQGQVVTAYEPYNGRTYTIDLDGTRYGGTLDVTSGLLKITHEMFDGGNKTWTKVTGNNYRTFYTGAANKYRYDANTPTVISSNYKSVCNNVGMTASGDNYVAVAAISGSSYVAIKDTSKANMTAEEFKTAMTGVTFVAELVTTTTVQLSPIQVETLLRHNVIWADSGKIINCTYRITNT